MIRFEDVSKRYGDTVAVDSLTLEIPPRTCTVLVGSSGCGKTTLMRMVNRMVDPTSGRVTIDGEDVAAKDPVRLRRGIGYVLQAAGLLPHRTVWQNVATVPMLDGVRKGAAKERALELLETVGLDRTLADRHPHQLSGGQQQRVAIARALVTQPSLLLCDEPTSALDTRTTAGILRLLDHARRELDTTVVLVTHELDAVKAICDRAAVLDAGRLVEVLPVERSERAVATSYVEYARQALGA